MLLPADAVEEIVGLRAAHARDEDEALDARRLGHIDLRLGAQPVDLLGRAIFRKLERRPARLDEGQEFSGHCFHQ